MRSKGIHHITAISGNPQKGLDFYGGVLGLRFTKKTVNHDDPYTYHLYFSNADASPGTHITFFPWENASKGKIGSGQVGITVYAIPKGSLGFWKNRLHRFDVEYSLDRRFNQTYLAFEDPDGLQIELVEQERGLNNNWRVDDITPDVAIKGFAGAVLYSENPDSTAWLLKKVLGLKKEDETKDMWRLVGDGDFGHTIDILKTPPAKGEMGVGTVHHIAFRASDNIEQEEVRNAFTAENYHVTPFIDRKYFRSIYVRECGFILLEVATDGPGFDVDEPQDKLAQTLTLPEGYERHRKKISDHLKPLKVRDAYVNHEIH